MSGETPDQKYRDDSYLIAQKIEDIKGNISDLAQLVGEYRNNDVSFQLDRVDNGNASSTQIRVDLEAMVANMHTLIGFYLWLEKESVSLKKGADLACGDIHDATIYNRNIPMRERR